MPPPPGERWPDFSWPARCVATFSPIGVVHASWRCRNEAPRQGCLAPQARACIVLRPGLQNALADLSGFDRLWIIAWLHRSQGWNHRITPPGTMQARGLFATRAPDRPNPIGLTCAVIEHIHGCRIWVRGHDLLDGTPVLDLKPYIPDYDAFPEARRGWLSER
ncbi:MAG: tRNA (N6-threonylcarbamoyladenosine(37)-N6)-methyltransferase TrmO [Rhodocyclaceae bacterium]|nr:tRNA (N6-threonylcarbamoyladenosine(37)-N6)-methyltransferase TrmO [Rhodocyclaceae bacterium]